MSLSTSTASSTGSLIFATYNSSGNASPIPTATSSIIPFARVFSTGTTVTNYPTLNLPGSNTSTSDTPWQECQASHVSYEEAVKNRWIGTTTTTTRISGSFTTSISKTVVYEGTASPPYTTIDGFPHIKGPYTTTATRTYASTTSWYEDPYDWGIVNVNFTCPTCVIPKPQCSSLWSSYLTSLGVPASDLATATDPSIIPTPSARPRCSVGDITTSCSYSTLASSCSILYNSVQLFYWPSLSTPAPADSPPMTAVHGTHTFTSPHVYLSLGTLEAYFRVHETCSTHSPLGATQDTYTTTPVVSPTVTSAVTGANSILTPGNILTLSPDEISSIIVDLGPGVDTSSLVRSLAFTDASGIMGYSYLTQPMVYARLTRPPASAYYLNPGPQGSQSFYEAFTSSRQPCATCHQIFDDLYDPMLAVPRGWADSLPEELRSCEWKDLAGLYDPPSALTEYTEAGQAVITTEYPAIGQGTVTTTTMTTATTGQQGGGTAAPGDVPGPAIPGATGGASPPAGGVTGGGGSAAPTGGSGGSENPGSSGGSGNAGNANPSPDNPPSIVSAVAGGGSTGGNGFDGGDTIASGTNPGSPSDPLLPGILPGVIGFNTIPGSAPQVTPQPFTTVALGTQTFRILRVAGSSAIVIPGSTGDGGTGDEGAGITISIGGPAVTVDGEILSVAPEGVVIGQQGNPATAVAAATIPQGANTVMPGGDESSSWGNSGPSSLGLDTASMMVTTISWGTAISSEIGSSSGSISVSTTSGSDDGDLTADPGKLASSTSRDKGSKDSGARRLSRGPISIFGIFALIVILL